MKTKRRKKICGFAKEKRKQKESEEWGEDETEETRIKDGEN